MLREDTPSAIIDILSILLDSEFTHEEVEMGIEVMFVFALMLLGTGVAASTLTR
jgi:hypothetical protein